jgi:hypothetical protein
MGAVGTFDQDGRTGIDGQFAPFECRNEFQLVAAELPEMRQWPQRTLLAGRLEGMGGFCRRHLVPAVAKTGAAGCSAVGRSMRRQADLFLGTGSDFYRKTKD